MLIAASTSSCERYLDLKPSSQMITRENVFNENATAIAAVVGMYEELLNSNSFSSGGMRGIGALAGLSADELVNLAGNEDFVVYENNELTAENSVLRDSYWGWTYHIIYQANSVIEGLAASEGVTPDQIQQLTGEALFVRAYCHFYLVNLFGDVPLITTTDYKKNSVVTRTATADVYKQIIEDLLQAKQLLSETYLTSERVRPNKAVAGALLSRAYLYTENWEKAEEEASLLIGDPKYKIVSDPAKVFLLESTEAIWQLKPLFGNTNEAETFILTYDPGEYDLSLNDALKNAFAAGDKRFSNWVSSYPTTTHGPVYFPYKYKATGSDQPTAEYSIVFRLAEQYLIRAEARAHLSDLSGAMDDVDTIRYRAGLPLIRTTQPGIGQAALLSAIEQERRLELFTEGGHRWLDLKRTGRANAVLGPLKADWEEDDMLYPLPQIEINNNKHLTQNKGY